MAIAIDKMTRINRMKQKHWHSLAFFLTVLVDMESEGNLIFTCICFFSSNFILFFTCPSILSDSFGFALIKLKKKLSL